MKKSGIIIIRKEFLMIDTKLLNEVYSELLNYKRHDIIAILNAAESGKLIGKKVIVHINNTPQQIIIVLVAFLKEHEVKVEICQE